MFIGTVYVVYQTTFHPLAKYPGPFLAKLTSFHAAYHAVKGTGHYNLYDLHQKYGPFIRYGPDHMSINSATALEQIYGHKANVQKGFWYRVFYGVSIFNAVDKDVHARKKRVMSQAFSDQALRGMQPHILSAIRDWCAGLGDSTSTDASNGEWASPKDMAHWGPYMIFDSLGEICFGKTFGTSLHEDNRFFLDLMAANIRKLNIIGQMPSLKRINLDRILLSGSWEKRQKQIAFSRKQLQTRLQTGPGSEGRRDVIYYLQQARNSDTGESYSEGELMSEVTLLLGAGSDTANTAVTATFYFLSQHREVLDRLTATIRSTFSDVESIVQGPALNSMKYLRACIDESLRLCPPVPMPLQREVLPGGLQVDGHHFAAGTTVGVPTYSLHHNVKYFDRPFVYDPSRWLIKDTPGVLENEGRTQEEVSRAREAFAPFSIGPRSCIGKSVALIELCIGISRVLWLYDLRIAPGYEKVGVGRHGEYKMKDHFIVGKEGPILQFRRR
ncbi:Isotrichodermin C-15 hydroxylase protein [Rutstroemia sp. NJR-2017a BVV2]|nr:Isotrichodermin C-15 hydroxylase protein [Rutstroemia sp. NJR-2017a BVV2]